MKKFALISHVLPPNWSGQSIILGRLLRDVDPESYVLISSSKIDNKHKSTENELLGRYYFLTSFFANTNFSTHHGFRILLVPFELIIRTIQMIRIIRLEHCNCIVACTGDILDIPCAYFAGLLTNRKLIPYYFDDYVFQWSNPLARNFARIFEKIIFYRTSQVIVPNEFMKETIDKRHNIKSTIIRNSMPIEIDKVESNKNSREDKKLIVFTGAIYQTNITALLTLFVAIEYIKDYKVEINIFTAQSVEKILRKQIEGDKIKIHSFASSAEIIIEQKSADILFIPFSFDSVLSEVIRTSSPGKLADYLESGVPILAFVPPNTYVAWFLKKYDCGYVVDINNPLELAKGIIELFAKEELRNKLIKNAMSIATSEFNTKKAYITFIGLLEEASK